MLFLKDSLNKAENILSTSNSKWLCGKLDVGTELILTLKLDVPSKISHINIGMMLICCINILLY